MLNCTRTPAHRLVSSDQLVYARADVNATDATSSLTTLLIVAVSNNSSGAAAQQLLASSPVVLTGF